MLTTKLGGASRRNALLLVTLAATLVAALGAYMFQEARISNLSSEIGEKSGAIELQNQELEQHAAAIAAQKKELGDKAAQLEDLNFQIETLAAEIASKDLEVNGLSATVAMQKGDLQMLRSEAENLQREIAILEDRVRSSEQQVYELADQVSFAQTQLDLAKRVQVKHYGLGVDQDNAGVVFPIEVEIIGAGDGTISLDVRNVQYEATFQTAVRTAATVASEHTGISIGDKDIIVRFINELDDSNDVIKVDGPSAGALITGMIIAGLTEEQIQPSVLITGAIKSDGTVGAVGGLESKINTAIDFGATTILVPKSQEFQDGRIQVIGVSDINEVVIHLIKR